MTDTCQNLFVNTKMNLALRAGVSPQGARGGWAGATLVLGLGILGCSQLGIYVADTARRKETISQRHGFRNGTGITTELHSQRDQSHNQAEFTTRPNSQRDQIHNRTSSAAADRRDVVAPSHR